MFCESCCESGGLEPSDQPVVYQYEIDAIRDSIFQIQSFFASEMNRLGYGKKTFEFETHIPVYMGARELSFYQDADNVRWQQGRILNKFPNDIHLVFVVGLRSLNIGDGAAGVFTHRCDATGNCDYRRLIAMPLEGNEEYRNAVTAHELGHAFGYLEHLTTREGYIMEQDLVITPGAGEYSLFNYRIHPDVARTLNQSNDLSVNNDVDTSKFDRIVRHSDTQDDTPILPELVAYYPFDGNVEDASGNRNDGRANGSINYVDGKFGDALELDKGKYILMQATDTLHGDIFTREPFTLSTWVYTNLETRYGHIWRSRLPATAGHTLFILGDGGISWRARINGEWSWGDLCETKSGFVKANEWVHVAVTNDGDKIRIYANGNLAVETDLQETDGRNTTYNIGSRFPDGAEAFAGWIDDYAIFSSALAESDINRIIEVGVKQFIDSPGTVVSTTDSHNDQKAADVNGDGTVDISDVKIVRSGMSGQTSYDTDLNNDGVTDQVDLAIVKAAAHAAIAAAAPSKRKVKFTTWGALKRR